MPQPGRGRAVSHATYVSAYSQLETLSDARTLAADPTTNLSFDSLVCILSQKTVERTKSTMGRHRERAPTYLAAYFGGTSLVELAADHRIPPSMLVRVILEHLGLRKGKEVKCTLHRTTFFVSSRFVTWYAISLSLFYSFRWANSSRTPSRSRTPPSAPQSPTPSTPTPFTDRALTWFAPAKSPAESPAEYRRPQITFANRNIRREASSPNESSPMIPKKEHAAPQNQMPRVDVTK